MLLQGAAPVPQLLPQHQQLQALPLPLQQQQQQQQACPCQALGSFSPLGVAVLPCRSTLAAAVAVAWALLWAWASCLWLPWLQQLLLAPLWASAASTATAVGMGL